MSGVKRLAVASCGCVNGYQNNYTGERFGMLIALNRLRTNDNGHSVWSLQCDCGQITEGIISDLQTGRKKSCGCRQGGYDQVEQLLDNSFRNAEDNSYFYVFTMDNYPNLCKPNRRNFGK